VAYKKDQGRFARMAAFWALFFLFAWGCLRADGLVHQIRGWLHDRTAWVDPFPLLGKLDLSMAMTLVIVLIIGAVIYLLLNRPRVADMLIDTESELRKVTWPTLSDTWKGTLAVVATVCFMLLYLTGADLLIRLGMTKLMGGG
jgi:preprotein translocase SecE subunit